MLFPSAILYLSGQNFGMKKKPREKPGLLGRNFIPEAWNKMVDSIFFLEKILEIL
jgi:hypothetical protein